MNRALLVALFAFIASIVLVFDGRVVAQFDTPNRSFHDAAAFRLEGRHLTVACASCHLNDQYQGTPTTCYACHWVRRKDDRYQTRLGTECEQCHRPVTWSAVNWNHSAMTGVALNASHRTISCESCHRDGRFTPGTVLCASCHRKDFDATRSPNHAAAGFPLACEGRHRPGDATWRTSGGAGFSHNAFFPLQGVHAALSCVSCHRNSVFRGTTRTCVGCHQAAYNATRDPNHAAAGFPTTCDACHRATDSTWTQGRFSHSAFPLIGPHNRRCNECHTTPNAFSQFNCTTCHSRSDMDHEHRDVRAYRYQSSACYACHPNGRE